MKRFACLVLLAIATTLVAQGAPRIPQQATAPVPPTDVGAKVWPAHRAEIEEFLRTGPIDHIDALPVGVTHPKRIFFKPGGPASSGVWKPIRPGYHGGYQDSYTAEIAAYEMDKLLGLDMVPPYVERRIEGEKGAVGLWLDNVKVWKISEPVRGPDEYQWSRQVVAMKMFDQLIGNEDRNQGNLLYDPQYNLILIDHSRAFTSSTDISKEAKLSRLVRPLWEKMAALTEAQLEPAIGKWVSKKELKAVLERRDKMAQETEKLVKERSERAVFMR